MTTDTNASPKPVTIGPFFFRPHLKKMIWGGSFIKYFKNIPEAAGVSIGESWEISGLEGEESVVAGGAEDGLKLSELIARYGERLLGTEPVRRYGMRFPLLVKYIDAARDLSVQVHPDDAMALRHGEPCGKNEMWHILRCRGGARIYAGFSHPISVEEYDSAVSSKTIMSHVAAHPTRSGDTFCLPAGTIHSIGAGNFLIEIQQTSGTTYRVYDFDRRDDAGRYRELHTELAREAMMFEAYDPECRVPRQRSGSRRLLADCEWARVIRHDVAGGSQSVRLRTDRFTIACCVEGELTAAYEGRSFAMPHGTTALLPAGPQSLSIQGEGSLLTITV